MTLREALAQARTILGASGISEAPLESEVLLRHVLGIDRARFYLDIERELDDRAQQAFLALVERRAKGEPAAYITGHREFFGLDFCVDSNVLIPRPETELLVAAVFELARRHPLAAIADIGTGSGAIAVSLATNLTGVKIYATDTSAGALAVARRNAARHGVAGCIIFLQGDLLAPLPGPVDIIAANLPYVRTADLVALSGEPVLALCGGGEGTDTLFELCRQASRWLNPGGSLVMEVGQGQAGAVTSLLRRLYPGSRIEVRPDLAGIDRLVLLGPFQALST